VSACSATSRETSPRQAAISTPSSIPSPGGSASASPSASTSQSGADETGARAADVYGHAAAGMLTPVTRAAKPLVYVPDSLSDRVDVLDPSTYKVVRSFRVPALPQHVVPSWDLKVLWVNDNQGNALTPIDPATGRPGRPVPVDDPYNLYFSPDGKHAMVMAEARRRIDLRDPHTMKLQRSLKVPCHGVNHADLTADLSTWLVSCEYSGELLVIPADLSRVSKVIDLNGFATAGATDPHTAMHHGGPAAMLDHGASAMPQDVRLAPDGRTFVVADMLRNGLWLVDAATFAVIRFVRTGKGAHGVYPSRDASVFYVSNRDGGSVSVVDAATLTVRTTWRIPGGGSPDMGGVTLDGSRLWLSGRNSSEVYVFATGTGRLLKRIRTGKGPHGLCVWPQPGRFSLGHTGNMR
jgi:YVTN family beta-propeller protein